MSDELAAAIAELRRVGDRTVGSDHARELITGGALLHDAWLTFKVQ